MATLINQCLLILFFRHCYAQVPDCLKSRSLKGVELESDERSQSSKMADRGPLERMFPGTYGARLLEVMMMVLILL